MAAQFRGSVCVLAKLTLSLRAVQGALGFRHRRLDWPENAETVPMPYPSISAAAVAAVAGFLTAMLFSAEAVAEEVTCYDRDVIVTVLERDFGEVQLRADLHGGPGLVEFFANLESGSWTILLSEDWDQSCVIGSGTLGDASAPA
ncbi:MAG: hypothetical protein AAFR79_03590 [Pseudomonadota bacterium]